MTTIFLIQPKTGNIGNLIIASGLEQLLRQAFNGEVNLVSLPADGGEKGGLGAKAIYEINRLADGLVIGPGNLFENGGLHCEIDALSSLGVPTMLFSVSMAQVYDRSGGFSRRTDSLPVSKIKAICDASDFILVRDNATRSFLEGLSVPDVRVGGCPSIVLNERSLVLPPPDPVATDAVLISIRHPALMSVPYSLHAKLRIDVRRLIDLARRRGHQNVKLLCHDRADLSFAAEFPDVPMLYSENVGRFLGWLRDCRMNLTFRLHAFIPSISLGTPAIHFSYDERALNLIETLGLRDWDIDFVNTPDILPRVEELWAAGEAGNSKPFLPSWNRFEKAMQEEMGTFAACVAKYAESHKF